LHFCEFVKLGGGKCFAPPPKQESTEREELYHF
jgi:hypothetical protein